MMKLRDQLRDSNYNQAVSSLEMVRIVRLLLGTYYLKIIVYYLQDNQNSLRSECNDLKISIKNLAQSVTTSFYPYIYY
jgi:hypothetical protein